MTTDADYQLISGSFGANWLAAGGNEEFISAASSYLSYASTFPYDQSDPDTVKAWVVDIIPTLEDGITATTTIGDAIFELSCSKNNGNVLSLLLNISKAAQ